MDRLLLVFVSLVCFSLSLMLSVYASVDPQHLGEEIAKRLSRVYEFDRLKKMVEKNPQVKIYLFGGTAAAFAHYVRWDLERGEQGYPYFSSRFDYDINNIYKANQDLDIVIDAPDKQSFAQVSSEIKELLRPTWSSAIDIHPLSDFKGNEDFLKQNNDSNSIGLIDLSAEENAVGDINKSHDFLRDVADARIEYYYDPKRHQQSSRVKEGKNPEILSAIRLLNKAIQYDLDIPASSMENLKKVIEEFDPKDPRSKEEYVVYWINKNALKLVHNGQDLHKAYALLEQLGLKAKLQSYGQKDGLALWLQKAPLSPQNRDISKLACKSAKSAEKLFASTFPQGKPIILSHETRSFDAYDSIMSSRKGTPNVFISRNNTPGESAAYGDGLYTRLGLQGGTGSGITIRFTLSPKACEGIDFKRVDSGILILNRDVISVRDEDLGIGMKDYIVQTLQGNTIFDHTNLSFEKKATTMALKKIKEHAFTENDLQDFFQATKPISFQNENTKKLLRALLDHDPFQTSWGHTKELHQAISTGDDVLASALLDQQPVSKSYFSFYFSPDGALTIVPNLLTFAISKGLKQTTEKMLANTHFNINGTVQGEKTPLITAIETQNEALALKLIQAGSDVTVSVSGQNGYSKDILQLAIDHGMDSLLNPILTKMGTPINQVSTNSYRMSPLSYAISNKKESCALTLLQSGADPNLMNPLALAIHYNLKSVVNWLLQNPATDLNKVDNQGVSPLAYALSMKREKMALQLIKAGADVNGATNGLQRGKATILQLAMTHDMSQVLELLLNNPAVDLNNDFNLPPLAQALQLKNEAVALKLLQHGADPAHAHALTMAACYGMDSMVDLLLKDPRVDVNESCPFWGGKGPLACALEGYHEAMALKLIQAGADVLVPAHDEQKSATILDLAIKRSLPKVVDAILKNRQIDLNHMPSLPLYEALWRKNETIFQALKNAGANGMADFQFLLNKSKAYTIGNNYNEDIVHLLNWLSPVPADLLSEMLYLAIINKNQWVAFKLIDKGANLDKSLKFPKENGQKQRSLLSWAKKYKLSLVAKKIASLQESAQGEQGEQSRPSEHGKLFSRLLKLVNPSAALKTPVPQCL
ncbi:MAG: hypothetical protein HQK50_18405 [Oligoflexia bacterium]|nr:hypothetical protein [Oligoflexia bacterium]